MDIENIKLRQRLHAAAEPSMKEFRTKEILMDWIEKHTSLKVVDRGSWFYAVYGEENRGPAMAFRADFDAVLCPDGTARHLCGHDGHSASLAALAAELDRCRPGRCVFLIFQPGEETGEGGRICSELIQEKHISQVYAFHNIPGKKEGSVLLLPGTFACASAGMELTFTGSPAHAAYPEQGKNPALILAEMIRFSQAILSEPHRGILLATVIGAELGSSSYGVSADRAVLRLTLRGEYQEEYNRLTEAVKGLAERLAEEQGFACCIRMIEEFPATVNDREAVKRVRRAAESCGMKTEEPEEPFRWSEDFGYYLQKTKGAMIGIGAGEKHPGLHTAEYEFNDSLIDTAVQLFINLVNEEGWNLF